MRLNSGSTTRFDGEKSQSPSEIFLKLDGELLVRTSQARILIWTENSIEFRCVEYFARMQDRLIIIVYNVFWRFAVKEIISVDWRNVSDLWSDLSFARAFSSAREKVCIKTECPAWTDLQVSRLSSGPQPARKPTFSCNPLSPLHNSMTFGTTFPGLFPRRVFWMFYAILRLPRW